MASQGLHFLPSIHLSEKMWSASTVCLLIQPCRITYILFEPNNGTWAILRVVMWHDYTWREQGKIWPCSPAPNWVVHICVRFSTYVRLTWRYLPLKIQLIVFWRGLYSIQHSKYCMWAMVAWRFMWAGVHYHSEMSIKFRIPVC